MAAWFGSCIGKRRGSGDGMQNDVNSNKVSSNGAHKPNLKKLNKRDKNRNRSDPELQNEENVGVGLHVVEYPEGGGLANNCQNDPDHDEEHAEAERTERPNGTTMLANFQQNTSTQRYDTRLAGAHTEVVGNSNITIPNANTVFIGNGRGEEGKYENKAVQTMCKDLGRGFPDMMFNELCSKVIEYIDTANNNVLQKFKTLCMVNSDDANGFGIPTKLLRGVEDGFCFIDCLRECKMLSPSNILFLQYLLHKVNADSQLQNDVLAFGNERKNNPLRMIVGQKSAVQGAVPVTFHIEGNLSDLTQMSANEFCDIVSERLGIPRHLITITELKDGSIIITLQMPHYWDTNDVTDCLLEQLSIPEMWIKPCKIFAIEIFGQIYKPTEIQDSDKGNIDKDKIDTNVGKKVTSSLEPIAAADGIEKTEILLTSFESMVIENTSEGITDKHDSHENTETIADHKHAKQEDLHKAARNGHGNVCESLIKAGADPNVADKDGFTPLHKAARNGHGSMCESLITAGANPNVKNKYGRTPLHYASDGGHGDVCESLLKAGADPNVADKNGFTQLNRAAGNGHDSICESLITAGANTNVKNKYGKTPLHYASDGGHGDVCESLLKAGADPNVADKDGFTPLQGSIWKSLITAGANTNVKNKYDLLNAARNGHDNVRESLIKAGADPNVADKDGFTPLHNAARNGHGSMCESLITAGANTNVKNKYGKTPLHYASEGGHGDVCESLLKAGADPNVADEDGDTPLHEAARNGHGSICESLITAGADPNVKNKYGVTPLHEAARNGHGSICESLITAGADPNVKNKYENTPLHRAAQNGHDKVCELLLNSGADPNVKNRWHFAPLDEAAQNGHVKVCESLIKLGADLTVKDKYGRTPLHSAAMRGHDNVCELLIKSRADINIKDDFNHCKYLYMGETPLHYAATRGHGNVCKSLLKAGADLNVTSTHGLKTPLHEAAGSGHENVYQLLIKAGADPNVKDRYGETPLHYAANRGHGNVCESLLKAGADLNVKSTRDLKTPLHEAARYGHDNVYQLLLKAGADPNVKDGNDRTPSDYAKDYTNSQKYKESLKSTSYKIARHDYNELLLDETSSPSMMTSIPRIQRIKSHAPFSSSSTHGYDKVLPRETSSPSTMPIISKHANTAVKKSHRCTKFPSQPVTSIRSTFQRVEQYKVHSKDDGFK